MVTLTSSILSTLNNGTILTIGVRLSSLTKGTRDPNDCCLDIWGSLISPHKTWTPYLISILFLAKSFRNLRMWSPRIYHSFNSVRSLNERMGKVLKTN